jgi:hypothetical protein
MCVQADYMANEAEDQTSDRFLEVYLLEKSWYVSVAHPRANGQVERTNSMVLDALKKRLHDAAHTKGGKWIKELPNALWGLRTQPTKPTGQSPYFLVYGFEAILPADVM